MSKGRKILITVFSIILLANIFIFGTSAYYNSKYGADSATTVVVRYITNQEVTDNEVNKIMDLAADPELKKTYNFVIIDKENDRYLTHMEEYKISGAKSTVITDRSGKKVFAKSIDWMSREQLLQKATELK